MSSSFLIVARQLLNCNSGSNSDRASQKDRGRDASTLLLLLLRLQLSSPAGYLSCSAGTGDFITLISSNATSSSSVHTTKGKGQQMCMELME